MLSRGRSPCHHLRRSDDAARSPRSNHAPRAALGSPGARVPVFSRPRVHDFPPMGKEPGFAGVQDAAVFRWVSQFRIYNEDEGESDTAPQMTDEDWSDMLRTANENGILRTDEVEARMSSAVSPKRRWQKGKRSTGGSAHISSPASGGRYWEAKRHVSRSNGAFAKKPHCCPTRHHAPIKLERQ